MQPHELRMIMQFNAAANRVVLETAAALTAEEFSREVSPSHGTVRQLLVHILGGEVYFLAQCQGQAQPDMSAIDALEALPAIRARFEQVAAETDAFIAGLSAADLDREVVLHFGEYEFRQSIWQLLLQVYSHAHMHRGELSIVLSQLGHPLPTIDMMVHFIKASGQEWPFG